MYLQVVGSIIIIILYSSFLRKGKELKALRYASAAAIRNGSLPYVTATYLT